MNTHHDTTTGRAGDVTTDDLRAEIHHALDQLVADARLLRNLTITPQRGVLSFLTPAARADLDRAVIADRTYRRTQPGRDLGLKFLNRDIVAAGTGHIRAPGSIPAIASDAEVWFTVYDLLAHGRRILTDAGLCVLHPLPDDPDTGDLIEALRDVVDHLSRGHLANLQRELDHLADLVDVAVNGNPRTLMDDPCPHCGRKTLVVHHRDELIRCDRDPISGHYEPCVCPDAFCDCKRTPVSHRHEWHRSNRHVHTWTGLSTLLTARRNAAADDTTTPKES